MKHTSDTIPPLFHPLPAGTPTPAKFNDPFNYTPHASCAIAVEEVKDRVAINPELRSDADRGKMFGVLVVETTDGHLGYIAAYSGLLAGRDDHPFFVPPVFSVMDPRGYFKVKEAEITAINNLVDSLSSSPERKAAKDELDNYRLRCIFEEDEHDQKMRAAKKARDERRASGEPITPEEAERMTRESQFMKAEAVRIRRRHAEAIAEKRNAIEALEREIIELRIRRRSMSDDLQRWLFSQYKMLNALGESRDLLLIFADTPSKTPPSGAGDCCAPKLLQYAYANHLRPVSMAEFWWGKSPKGETRRQGYFYPACRGKCLPILGHMLRGLEIETSTPNHTYDKPLERVYEDEWLTVVCKPAGMPTVPGKDGSVSLVELMSRSLTDGRQVIAAHRLDMDTSGLVIIAHDMETYKNLQLQFTERTVSKRYVAVLDGVVSGASEGLIALPLLSDPLDRPYQKVDRALGKTATTRYRVISTLDDKTRVALFPLTGRTHQLRVHCAHADGLNAPIVGDRLYGQPADRLLLHAEAITFTHPATGETLTLEREADF